MSPAEFVDLMLPEEDRKAFHVDIDEVERCIPGIFGKILHSTEADTLCNDITYSCEPSCHATTDAEIGRYCESHSLGDVVGSVLDQVLAQNSLQNPGDKVIITISNGVSSGTNEAVAQDYASHFLSSAAKASPEQMVMSLMDLMF